MNATDLPISVLVVSTLRLAWRIQATWYPPLKDPTYDIRFIYSTVETNLAIICASLPGLYSLVSKWFPKFFSRIMGKSEPQFETGGVVRADTGSASWRARALHTIGGSELPLSNMRSNSNGRSQKSSRKSSTNTSEEELVGDTFDSTGIMKTTNVNVVYDATSMEKSRPSQLGESNSASLFRYNESMRSTRDHW